MMLCSDLLLVGVTQCIPEATFPYQTKNLTKDFFFK